MPRKIWLGMALLALVGGCVVSPDPYPYSDAGPYAPGYDGYYYGYGTGSLYFGAPYWGGGYYRGGFDGRSRGGGVLHRGGGGGGGAIAHGGGHRGH